MDVWIKRYHKEPQLLNNNVTPKQAYRLLGSYIRGKRRINDLEEAYATGRFGWRYSQAEIKEILL